MHAKGLLGLLAQRASSVVQVIREVLWHAGPTTVPGMEIPMERGLQHQDVVVEIIKVWAGMPVKEMVAIQL